MTENRLTAALADFLRKELSDFRLDGPDGRADSAGAVSVGVYEGFLPAKRSSEGDDFPCCIVRPVSGTIEDEGTGCSVDMIFGVFDTSEEGYKTVLNVMRRAANALLVMPGRLLAGRYILDGGMSWELDSEQPYPSYVISLHTEWTFRTPQIVTGDDAGGVSIHQKSEFKA